MNISDMQSEETYDIILELSVGTVSSPRNSHRLFRANITYFNEITSGVVDENGTLNIIRSGNYIRYIIGSFALRTKVL